MKRPNFSKLIFEFISVSFAVLIALFVNQWREDFNSKKLAEKAIYNIKEELTENRDIMIQLITNHKSVLFEVDSLIETGESRNFKSDSIKDIEVTLISSSAWKMAQITKAIFYIDFDKANNLSKVYNFQSYYESIVKEYVLENSYNHKNKSDIESIKNTKRFLETIISMEEDLKSYYNLMLNEILTEENKK